MSIYMFLQLLKNQTVALKKHASRSLNYQHFHVENYWVWKRLNQNQQNTPCLKKTSHLWLAITLTHMNGFWYFFGRNVADNVGNQKTLYFTMPPQIISASVLPGKTGKHENHIFHSVRLCYTHNAPVLHLPERKKLLSVMFLIASDVCWDNKISH